MNNLTPIGSGIVLTRRNPLGMTDGETSLEHTKSSFKSPKLSQMAKKIKKKERNTGVKRFLFF